MTKYKKGRVRFRIATTLRKNLSLLHFCGFGCDHHQICTQQQLPFREAIWLERNIYNNQQARKFNERTNAETKKKHYSCKAEVDDTNNQKMFCFISKHFS